MSAYLITEIDVHDEEGHQAYREAGPPTLPAHGGRLIARGGELAVIEGDWEPKRLVIAEFSDLPTIKRWYESPEYQEAKKLRENTATLRMVAVAGL